MSESSPRRQRRILLLVLGILVIGGAIFFALPTGNTKSVEPPSVDLSSVDPAVKDVIEREMQRVREAPESGAAWGRLGLALHANIFGVEAIKCFERAEELEPWNPRWPYFQALAKLADDPPAALPKLRRTVELAGDDNDGPHVRLAETEQLLGNVPVARAEFEAIVRKNPKHPLGNLGLARADLGDGNLQSARERLALTMDHPSTRKAARMLAAEIFQTEGNLPAAQQERSKAAGLPDDAAWPDPFVNETAPFEVGESARLKRAGALVDRQRVREAYSELQQIVRDYPKSAMSWQLLGWLQLSLNQTADAESSLRTSLANDPKQARTWFYLGLVHHRRKENDKAIEAWTKAAELKPSYLEAHFNIGLVSKETGKPEAAIAAFENALRCQPLSAPAHAQLGAVLWERGKTERAIEHLKQAVELNPKDEASRKLLEAKPPMK